MARKIGEAGRILLALVVADKVGLLDMPPIYHRGDAVVWEWYVMVIRCVPSRWTNHRKKETWTATATETAIETDT